MNIVVPFVISNFYYLLYKNKYIYIFYGQCVIKIFSTIVRIKINEIEVA